MSLPSLNSLRTFESAARLKSFSLAAEELFVSPSAVSHQIRLLEDRLEVKLFQRLDRKVELSKAGQSYYDSVQKGLKILEQATNTLLSTKEVENGSLNLSVVPFFATRWLFPKLADFRRQFPDCKVNVQTSTAESNFSKENLDLVIRRGIGPWSGMASKLICKERLAAVCSPQIHQGIKEITDLFEQPLLFNAQVMTEWQEWFAQQRVEYQVPQTIFEFQNTSQILDACLSGAGVALIDPVLIKKELSQGDLIDIFGASAESLRSYFIVYPEDKPKTTQLDNFETWLYREIEVDPVLADRAMKK